MLTTYVHMGGCHCNRFELTKSDRTFLIWSSLTWSRHSIVSNRSDEWFWMLIGSVACAQRHTWSRNICNRVTQGWLLGAAPCPTFGMHNILRIVLSLIPDTCDDEKTFIFNLYRGIEVQLSGSRGDCAARWKSAFLWKALPRVHANDSNVTVTSDIVFDKRKLNMYYLAIQKWYLATQPKHHPMLISSRHLR